MCALHASASVCHPDAVALRFCACGCGQPIVGRPNKRFISNACRQRQHRQQHPLLKTNNERRSAMAMLFDGNYTGQPRAVGRSVPPGTAGMDGWVTPLHLEAAHA